MPRLSTSLIHQARRIHSFLPLLLRSCRDLPSACNELRWLREHAIATTSSLQAGIFPQRWEPRLYQLCLERSRGRPLQYILGNQPFGDLDIICRSGVLIPRLVYDPDGKLVTLAKYTCRPETEAYTACVANLLVNEFKICLDSRTAASQSSRPFRILDLCTGSGCISLLLHAILSDHLPQLEVLGVDISSKAIGLAKENLRHNIIQAKLSPIAQGQIHFVRGNVFDDMNMLQGEWDMVISNPPYISPREFRKTTARSVRNHEPKIALVPQEAYTGLDALADVTGQDSIIGDKFYPKLLEIAERLGAKIIIAEVADIGQAKRVSKLAAESGHWNDFEIWRDWPDPQKITKTTIEGALIKIRGEGNGRSIIATQDSLANTVKSFLCC